MAKVDEFLSELRLADFTRRRMRREILFACGLPPDVPPPPPTVPAIASQMAQIRWHQGELFPGQTEELRRAALHLIHTFAIRTRREPRAVVDALGKIVERRFYPLGIGLVSVDGQDGYGGKSAASTQMERLGDLFRPGAR